MKTISKLKAVVVTFLSLCSTSLFAGGPIISDEYPMPPVSVSEPSILALLGVGVVVALFVAKRRKK